MNASQSSACKRKMAMKGKKIKEKEEHEAIERSRKGRSKLLIRKEISSMAKLFLSRHVWKEGMISLWKGAREAGIAVGG